MKAIVVVHGGAGNIPDSRVPGKMSGVRASVCAGVLTLLKTKSATNAACSAVASMEDDPVFNAGFGSVLNEDGNVEMDAAVMNGKDLDCGGVAAVERVKNPVLLAQKVLEKSPHCLLASSGAERFAASFGVETVPGESLVSQGAKQALTHNLRVLQGGPSKTLLQSNEGLITNEIGHEDEEGRDTVGAVVRDFDGNLAAATSTGGLTGKAKGRVGDSPIIGAGLYADNQKGAVSTTGQGECLYRHLVAFRIAEKLAEAAATAEENEAGSTIVRSCLDQMSERVGGDGGAISIDTRGQIAIEWNSMRMSWAYAIVDLSADNQTSLLKVHSGCNKGEHFIQDLPLQSL